MVVFLDVVSLEPSEGFCETSIEMADVNESVAGPSSPRAPTTLSEDSQSISVTAPETAASDGSGDVGAQPTRSPANGDRMSVAAMVTPTGSPKPSSTPERQANPQRAEIKDDDGPKGAGGKRGTSNGAAEEGKSAPSQPSEEVDRSAEETERDTKVTDGSDGEVDRQIPGSEKEGREDAGQDEGHEGDDGDDNEGDDGGEDEGEDVNDDSEEEEEEEEEEDDDDDDASDSGSEDDSRSVSRESAMEGVEATEAEGKRESGTAEPSQEKGDAEMDHEKGSDEGKDAGEVATEEAGGHIAAPKPKPKKKRRITPSLEPAPQGPPPRPTVRLALIVSHDDDSEYMANVPVEVYKHLKAKNDPYAAWFEESKGISSALAQEEAEQERGSQRPDLSEFGDLARLLEKYPVDKGNKKRKRAGPDDEYDVRDPFVDDSELNVDEPTHSAKPSSDGFFVTEGPVELAQMKRSKQLANKASGASNGGAAGSGGSGGGQGGAKRSAAPVFTQPVDGIGGVGEIMIEHPSSKVLPQVNILLHRWAVYTGAVHPQPPPPVAQAQVDGSGGREAAEGAGAMGVSSLLNGPNPSESPVRFDGTRQSPIKVDDDDGDPRRPAPPLNDGRKASRYPTIPVDLKLQEAFDNLRQQIARESWLNKAKFPPALKPPLVNVAMLAIDLGEYTDNFFNHLPQLFPYNRFTMQKLTKREAFNSHQQKMTDLREVHIEALQRQIQEHLPAYKREYEEAYQRWLDEGGADREGAQHDGPGASTPAGEATNEEAGLADGEDEGAPKSEGSKPVKRWKWNDQMREILFTIVAIEDAIVELRNEKTELEKSTDKASNITSRKALYKRLSDLWPEEGWTTTTYISREMGLYKRKVDRYVPHVEEIVPAT